MDKFSDALKKNHNMTDSDEKKIMALYDAFAGVRTRPFDFIDAIEKLHKLGWHHDNEVIG